MAYWTSMQRYSFHMILIDSLEAMTNTKVSWAMSRIL
uniref:Uncharacterized protein n=1 Tax=Arundo donax TaxID=35708 RepID=A0A0A9HG99_ARUDO